MIAQGLLLFCAVAYSQGFLFNPRPQQWVPVPIFKLPPKHIIQHVPIVKHVREPVYVNRIISVPQDVDSAAIPIGSVGGASGAVGGASAGSSLGSFGLNAQIEDADTVNIVAGVSGFGGAGQSFDNNNNNNFNNNDDGFGRSFGGQSFGGFRGGQQIQPRVSVSQTQISQPSTRVSQPQIVGKGGHGLPPKGFGHF